VFIRGTLRLKEVPGLEEVRTIYVIEFAGVGPIEIKAKQREQQDVSPNIALDSFVGKLIEVEGTLEDVRADRATLLATAIREI